MPDRRGRKGPIEYPIQHDKAWAEDVWRDRETIGDAATLREAARVLGLPDEEVDRVLRP